MARQIGLEVLIATLEGRVRGVAKLSWYAGEVGRIALSNTREAEVARACLLKLMESSDSGIQEIAYAYACRLDDEGHASDALHRAIITYDSDRVTGEEFGLMENLRAHSV